MKQNILQYQKLWEEIKGKLPPAFTPESLRYCFKLKRQVFWLSPIVSSLPGPEYSGTVTIIADNMKGLQLRVQLRIFPIAIGVTGFPRVSNENHFSTKIEINFPETVKNSKLF